MVLEGSSAADPEELTKTIGLATEELVASE